VRLLIVRKNTLLLVGNTINAVRLVGKDVEESFVMITVTFIIDARVIQRMSVKQATIKPIGRRLFSGVVSF